MLYIRHLEMIDCDEQIMDMCVCVKVGRNVCVIESRSVCVEESRKGPPPVS